MKSLKELYRIGNGPSSSHTMGPKKAAEMFLDKNKDANKFIVTLYGSLAATGKGHLTDQAVYLRYRDDDSRRHLCLAHHGAQRCEVPTSICRGRRHPQGQTRNQGRHHQA